MLKPPALLNASLFLPNLHLNCSAKRACATSAHARLQEEPRVDQKPLLNDGAGGAVPPYAFMLNKSKVMIYWRILWVQLHRKKNQWEATRNFVLRLLWNAGRGTRGANPPPPLKSANKMRIGASKLLNSTKRRTECDWKCGLFSPNSVVVRPIMHSRIKSPATRECAPPHRGERRAMLIAKVIKPINAVLCAACHCVQEIMPLITAGLFFFFCSHKPPWDWQHLQVLSTLVERYLSIALVIIMIKTNLFLFFWPRGKIIQCLLSSYFILDTAAF